MLILLINSLKFVPRDSINNNPALVHIMAWHLIGDKPLYDASLDHDVMRQSV